MEHGYDAVLKTTSLALGIGEAEFIAIYQELQESERAEELRLADQGQLHDIMSANSLEDADRDEIELSEDQVIEIIELITRQKLETERKSIVNEEEGD